MLWKLLIFYGGLGGVDVKHGAAPYGKKKITYQSRCAWPSATMTIMIMLALCLALFHVQATQAETEFFPGLRKPPQISNWAAASQNENAYLLAQLSNIIEEEARRRFQIQLQQQQQQQLLQQQQKHHHGPVASQEIAAPGFTYQLPINGDDQPIDIHDKIPFAVSPADPRYYEKNDMEIDNNNNNNNNNINNKILSSYEDDYSERDQIKDDQNISVDRFPAHKLKAPMEVKPKIVDDTSKSRDVMTRDDIQYLMEKLHKSGQEGAIINSGPYLQRSDVIKKQVEMDPTMGMYVVALIAGVSAAVTVGLIALGIGWYTLHKKGIAAADVEYPAYGVTGPNKDISPSGDRRLAQSAQMYHYQHQKQQIIALENRTNNERNGALSDVESDDENEEGDYTVYECPGLAPTGEMEVKNPLFLDDPTPATPATAPTTTTTTTQPTKTNTNTSKATSQSNQPTASDKNQSTSDKK